jgi:hypothetical protein
VVSCRPLRTGSKRFEVPNSNSMAKAVVDNITRMGSWDFYGVSEANSDTAGSDVDTRRHQGTTRRTARVVDGSLKSGSKTKDGSENEQRSQPHYHMALVGERAEGVYGTRSRQGQPRSVVSIVRNSKFCKHQVQSHLDSLQITKETSPRPASRSEHLVATNQGERQAPYPSMTGIGPFEWLCYKRMVTGSGISSWAQDEY